MNAVERSKSKPATGCMAAARALRRALGAWLICACVAPLAAVAQSAGELSDLAARLQFHFYAGDSRALRQDMQSLSQLPAEGPHALLRGYYLAYGQMSLYKTLAGGDRGASRKAAGECVQYADEALEQPQPRAGAAERARSDALKGELWAIKAVCLGGSVLGSANKARERAAELAPHSPRVLLLAAVHDAEGAKSARELQTAHDRLSSVAAAFQNAKPADPGYPDWGQAEAWAWLGHMQLRRGDRLGARESIERALVLAPDYQWAIRLRAEMTSGR